MQNSCNNGHTGQITDFRAFEANPGISVILLTNAPIYTHVAVSNDFLTTSGMKKEDVIGKGHFELFPQSPEDKEFTAGQNLKASFDFIIQNKKAHEIPIQRYDIPNGNGTFSERYWKIKNVPILNESGEVSYIIHTAEDVTTQIKANQREKALEGIEKSYNIFMHAPVIICIVKGDDYTIELANDGMLEVWGRTKDVIGKPLLQAIPELEEQGFIQLLDQVKKSGEVYKAFENPATLVRNGIEEVLYFDFVYQPYYENKTDTVATGVIGVAHDVTEKVRARKKVDEVTERLNFRNALFEAQNEATPDGVLIVDAGGKMILQNKLFGQIWKMPQEIINSKDDDAALQHAMTMVADPQGFIERVTYLYHKKSERSFDEILFKDGRVIERTGTPIIAANGSYYGWAWYFRDITYRIRQEQKFRNVIQQVPDPILIFKGKDLVLEVANTALFNLWQVGEEALGKPFLEILPEMKEQLFVEQMLAVMHTGQPFYGYEMPAVFNRKNGFAETRYVNISCQPYRAEDETHISGVLVTATDVTGFVLARQKVEESNKELKFVMDFMPQLVWHTLPDGNADFFNQVYLDYTGLSMKQLAGHQWTTVVHPDDLSKSVHVWEQAVTGKNDSYTVEHRLLSKEGRYRWFLSRGLPLKDEQGHILRWYGTTTDIQSQKLSEEALRQSKDRFDLVAKATQDAIWDWNLITNDIWWNEGFKKLFGYAEEEIESGINSWYLRLHPEDKERVVNGIHEVIDNGGKQWSDEYRFRKADGTYAIVFDRGHALHNEEGKPYRMLGSMQNITERKNYETSLAASEERLRTLANSINQLAWMAEADGWIYWYNQRWYEYTGTTLEEMQGWGWEKVHHPDYIHSVVSFVKEAWHKGKPFELIFPLRRQDGVYRWFLTRVFPVKNNKGQVIQWIGTNTDIDEQKQTEVLLEERVKARTQELEKKNKELEQFTYAASHDLQEPLRKIATFSNFLIESNANQLDERSRSFLEKIDSSVKRMKMIIDDLLQYSHQTREDQQFVATDLNEVIENIKVDLDLLIQQKDAIVFYDQLPVLKAVPSQIHQLFYNLINNALKFSKPGVQPNVTISATTTNVSANEVSGNDSENQYVQITVADNGIGFGQEYAEQIFSLFKRLHGRSEYEGTGIGLALCKKITENHGGKIWAESEPGEGTLFKVLLPLN